MSTDPNQVPDSYLDQWSTDVASTNNLIQQTLVEAENKVAMAAAMMATLPTMTAYHMIPLVMGLVSQEQGIEQVAAPSSALDSQNDALDLVSLTQSLFNQLIAGSTGFALGTGMIGPSDAPGVTPDTKAQQEAYVNTFAEFQECLVDLNTMFGSAVDPNSAQYQWCSQSVADSMTQSVSTINTAMEDLDGGIEYSGDTWTNAMLFSYNCFNYNQNPSASPYAADFNMINQSLNSMASTMNYVTSSTTGQMKAGTSEIQQFYGSVESAGKSMQQQAQYWVNNQLSQ